MRAMEEVAWVRHLVDRAISRLESEPADHPLRQLDRLSLRRELAEAAYREIRKLAGEIEPEASRGDDPARPGSGSGSGEAT
jgi:hypothetical protein